MLFTSALRAAATRPPTRAVATALEEALHFGKQMGVLRNAHGVVYTTPTPPSVEAAGPADDTLSRVEAEQASLFRRRHRSPEDGKVALTPRSVSQIHLMGRVVRVEAGFLAKAEEPAATAPSRGGCHHHIVHLCLPEEATWHYLQLWLMVEEEAEGGGSGALSVPIAVRCPLSTDCLMDGALFWRRGAAATAADPVEGKKEEKDRSDAEDVHALQKWASQYYMDQQLYVNGILRVEEMYSGDLECVVRTPFIAVPLDALHNCCTVV